jgi:hypothetical protein
MSSNRVTYTYSLSDVSFDSLSEEDFRFSMILLSGTAAYMQDAPHIEHMWLNGRIVPKTDETILELLRGNGFMPGTDSPRFWMIWLSVLLIVIALGKRAYDHFIKKKVEA